MELHFDVQLKELNNDILKMGVLVEEAIHKAVEALKNNDKELANFIISNDKNIDEMELAIDEKCMNLIATHQPMAKDLRFIATAMKLNGELERIADIAVDIAQRMLKIADKPHIELIADIPKLADIAQNMVNTAINSFINRDATLAAKVLSLDPQADSLRNSIQKELVEKYMIKHTVLIPGTVQMLLIARFLERTCDHATNIAEDIIYMVKAEVVKHHPEKLKEV